MAARLRSGFAIEEDPAMRSSLDALRAADLDHQPSKGFDLPIIRRWRHERSAASPAFWAPFAAAAVLAGLLAFALAGALESGPAAPLSLPIDPTANPAAGR
jgi:hypothetical protein